MDQNIFKKITFILSIFVGLGAAGIVLHSLLKSPRIEYLKMNDIATTVQHKKKVLATMVDSLRIYVRGAYRDTWKKGIKPTKEQRKEQRCLLGYNLEIEHIRDCDPRIINNPKHPTLYLHGWGDIKNSAKLLKAYCDVLPGDIVTFNFRDRGILLPKLRYSNLGQLPDVLSALYALKWTKDMLNPEAIDLFGYSRGGATTINMIAVLNDKQGTYDQVLAKIGIDAQERAQLLTLIQNGCIVLNCPLTDLNISARNALKDLAPHALKTLARIGKYEIDGLQALESANKLGGLNLKILVHYQYNDKVVSNYNESEFYRRLAQNNLNSTYVVLGNDGGHAHTHDTLSKTIHTFKHMAGGSYDPVYDMQYKLHYAHAPTCSTKLLRPGIRIDSCIKSFNQWCTQHEEKKPISFPSLFSMAF